MELLLLTLMCSIISAFIPLLVKIAVNYVYRVSKEEILMKEEALSLRKQMNAISMVDEFAKHAKLQRKLNKVNDELKRRATASRTASMKKKFIMTYLMHAVMGLILLCIVWMYRSVPVIVFPEDRLWPISGIVSWPTGVPGGVSVAVWIFVTNKVARTVAAYVTQWFFSGNKNAGKKAENGLMNMHNISLCEQQTTDELH